MTQAGEDAAPRLSPDDESADGEWLSWYRLSPVERFGKRARKLWATYLALGGSLDPELDSQSPFDDPEAGRASAAHAAGPRSSDVRSEMLPHANGLMLNSAAAVTTTFIGSDFADKIYLDRVRRARATSLSDKFREGLQLFDIVAERMKVGVRIGKSDVSEEECLSRIRQQLALLRRLHERGIYRPLPEDGR